MKTYYIARIDTYSKDTDGLIEVLYDICETQEEALNHIEDVQLYTDKDKFEVSSILVSMKLSKKNHAALTKLLGTHRITFSPPNRFNILYFVLGICVSFVLGGLLI